MKVRAFVGMVVASMTMVAWSGFSDVTLSKVFSSNMVLQRDKPITVWGWADAGEKVSVKLGDESATTVADGSGRWQVVLPKRGIEKSLSMTVTGNNKIRLDNILMGDVWLCSGQSNMEFGIRLSKNSKQAIEQAKHPMIRLFWVDRRAVAKAGKKLGKTGGWDICTPETVVKDGRWGGFSAVAYYFGLYLQKNMPDVPIGLLHSSWGGSRIEPWTNEDGWKSVPELTADYKKMKALKRSQIRLGNQTPIPALYNGMIYPFRKLAIKGTIWYQGESNRKDGGKYFYRKEALVNGWRSLFGKDMPFYFVQLAPFAYKNDKQGKNKKEWLPVIWEAQTRCAQEIHNVKMAVTIDVGNFNDIHPADKDTVGKRLALLALKYTYGKKVVADSPTYDSAKLTKDGLIVIKFKNVGGGLVTRDAKEKVLAFEAAGADGKFRPVDAHISGKDSVTLAVGSIAKPIKVRYAWSNTPTINLTSKEGLPVGSFRFTIK